MAMHKEVYCEDCWSFQPLMQSAAQSDTRNPSPWYDLLCDNCRSIIAALHLAPDNNPTEPSE
jgi:hypothetical protein